MRRHAVCLIVILAACGGGPSPDPEPAADARVSSDPSPAQGDSCPDGQIACDDDAMPPVCVGEDKFCDGMNDCPNGEDESPDECVNPCPTMGEYPCNDGTTCIPEEQFCDGTNQCPDGEDEDPAECAS